MRKENCEESRMRAQNAAAELYQVAALMMGDDSEAATVVEATVAQMEIDPCADAESSLETARLKLVEISVSRLSKADPQAFLAPVLPTGSGTCIEEDDLSADQLAGMAMDGPGSRALRGWLNQLTAIQRVVFVQRAILGWDNAAIAKLLEKAGSGTWLSGQVGEIFRQALCSLVSSLVASSQ